MATLHVVLSGDLVGSSDEPDSAIELAMVALEAGARKVESGDG
jgi:hypothetical protein